MSLKSNVFFLGISFLLFFSKATFSQLKPTDFFKISGQIKNEIIVSLNDLDSFEYKKIKNQSIKNHLGEIKENATHLKGILLKDILSKVEIEFKKHSELNEYIFVLIASDNYKVVFSWNELFNSEIGNHTFLITEIKGKKIQDYKDRILIISTKDFNTGRRYIKGLKDIIVKRIE